MTSRIVTDGITYRAQLLVPFWFGRWGRLVWRHLAMSDFDNYRDCERHLAAQLRRREGWKVVDGRAPVSDPNEVPPLPRFNSKTLERVS